MQYYLYCNCKILNMDIKIFELHQNLYIYQRNNGNSCIGWYYNINMHKYNIYKNLSKLMKIITKSPMKPFEYFIQRWLISNDRIVLLCWIGSICWNDLENNGNYQLEYLDIVCIVTI